MNPTYVIENTFNPVSFTASATAGTVATKSDNTWLIILVIFLLAALAYAAWEYSERTKSGDSRGAEAY